MQCKKQQNRHKGSPSIKATREDIIVGLPPIRSVFESNKSRKEANNKPICEVYCSSRRGIIDVAPKRTGMRLRRLHSLFGNALCASHTKRGATAPPRKNQLTFPYSPSTPNILNGHTKPHITDSSKNTVHWASPWTVRWQQGGITKMGNLFHKPPCSSGVHKNRHKCSHHLQCQLIRSQHYRFTVDPFKRAMTFGIANRELTCAMNIDRDGIFM